MRLPCKVGDNVWNNDFGLRGVVGRAAKQGHIVCLTKKREVRLCASFLYTNFKNAIRRGKDGAGNGKAKLI